MIRYECQNCGKKFELAEGSEIRCPHCFWTTSVRPLNEHVTSKSHELRQPVRSAKPLIKINPHVVAWTFLAIGVMAAIYYLPKTRTIEKVSGLIHEKISESKSAQRVEKPKENPPKALENDPLSLLSNEERAVLENRILFEIPRKLSDEEKEILNRKVEFNIGIEERSSLEFWTLEKFEKFIKSEQTKRQIFFSWGYEKSLLDLFKNHYLKAQTLFVSGQAEAARTELLAALIVPRYSEDEKIHRAVGLVMLKEFIDDVVRKVKVINSYSSRKEIMQRANQLKEDHGNFFNLMSEERWDEALRFAGFLQEQAKNLDSQTTQLDIQYPPIFAQIDPDIKASLNVLTEDFTAISSNLSSFLADLKIKRNTIHLNTAESLNVAKNQYESAMQAIQEKRWADARDGFESISYPPEVTADAKHKAAILNKLVPPSQST